MILAFALFAQTVTVSSLLSEMSDLNRLTSPAPYTAAQASSYDRASKSPTQDWFANGDAGKFLRAEGREQVMADLKGPGAVVRIWSANPAGNIRFYFDGETTPRLQAPMGELLRGQTAPFGPVFAYEASKGCNLYFPFPYAKSLKITAEGEVGGLYYHVGHRSYSAGTNVETFDGSKVPDLAQFSIATAARSGGTWSDTEATLQSGQSVSMRANGPSVIRELRMHVGQIEPASLSSLIFTMTVDGKTTIVAPVGEFFGTSPGIVPYSSQPMEVRQDGTLICRFPMPIGKTAKLEVENRGRKDVRINIRAQVEKVAVAPELRFHAQWSYDRGFTRPMRDLGFVSATGTGRFVGAYLHVENPTPSWWGEGDEKVYVDGETFPSTFGTGTEDYFGYAWCWPAPFIKPYHGQTRCDGPGNFGHTSVYRWQTFDDIPFTTSLKFDLEMWHWAEVTATWSRTAYWYATPGSTGNHSITPKAPVTLEAAKPVKGALEGEAMEVVSITGGKHEAQDGFWELSGGKQRWWMDAAPGDRLVLKFPVAQSGRYEIIANLCHAKDYGIHEILINGKKLALIDFYSDGLGWQKHTFGTLSLEAGLSTIEIVCRGNNPKAVARRMFGLDYLLLKSR